MIEVTADVTNTGSRAGDAVVQLYIHQRAGSASRPVRQLKGFERIALEPGAKQTVHFTLGKDELQFWSPHTEEMGRGSGDSSTYGWARIPRPQCTGSSG